MSAPTAPILGANGKLYRNTGTYGSPTWDLVPNCRSITGNHSWSDVNVSGRAGGAAVQHEPGLIDFDFSIEMLYDPSDTDFTTIRDAAFARTGIEFALLDQASGTAGSYGTRAFCKFFNYKRPEEIDGIMSASFDIKNAYSTNPPAAMTTS